jgi:hypothetical protein
VVLSTLALLAFVLSEATPALARSHQKPAVKVAVSASGPKLQVRVVAVPRSLCVLRVSVRRKSVTFPAVRASEGGARGVQLGRAD